MNYVNGFFKNKIYKHCRFEVFLQTSTLNVVVLLMNILVDVLREWVYDVFS